MGREEQGSAAIPLVSSFILPLNICGGIEWEDNGVYLKNGGEGGVKGCANIILTDLESKSFKDYIPTRRCAEERAPVSVSAVSVVSVVSAVPISVSVSEVTVASIPIVVAISVAVVSIVAVTPALTLGTTPGAITVSVSAPTAHTSSFSRAVVIST